VELDVFGTGLERWERGYPAALDALLAALRTGRVRDPPCTGQLADDLELVPRSRGDLPVITAVTSEDGLRTAADRGLPMLLGMHADDEEKAALIADLLCRLHPVGSPGHCVRTLAATAHRTGVEHLILMVETTGELARTLETISRLGAEVLPRLRRQPAVADTDDTAPATGS
jgi:hypothetical protein